MNKTRYRIIVERSEVIETVTRREWTRGDPDGRSADGEYGYTPQIPMTTTETVALLDMKLSELELDKLVGAILECGTV